MERSGADGLEHEGPEVGFTPVIERDGDWFIATCPEIPGANGQGRTREACLESLAHAVELVLEGRLRE